ncbi:ribonuclease III [Sulfuriflexus mobilis]|uniref:ribonuclease III n=1 Tax=Sulfuriflexus mobilis TaxID=1811807 RepID=UPI0018D576DF|nr:ribonuclease III [Sulfuriflexus mobilis]
MIASLDKLIRHLDYRFGDEGLLETALTHRSVTQNNNERLEFLGDAVLGMVIAEELFRRFPSASEGELSRLRASLVKGDTLAEVARSFELGDVIRLGQGELKSGGFRRKSILADAFEAILGAIYLDGGFENCRRIILKHFSSRIAMTSPETALKDPKTRLQEYLQASQQALPDYEVVDIAGEAHAQTFTVECRVEGEQAVRAQGSSRRKAEQAAASKILGAIVND